MTIKLKRALSFVTVFMLLFSFTLTGDIIKPVSVSAAQLSASVSLTDSNITDLNTPVTVNLALNGFPYTGNVPEPNDVVLLIDRSGSMRNDYSDMIATAKFFVNKLDLSTHRIGIVLYDSSVDVLGLTNDKTVITDYLDNALNIGVLGSTNMAAGIDEAVKMLKGKRSSAHGSIVLMTDGEPDNVEKAEASAKNAKNTGNAFYTVALCPSETSPANVMLKKMATTETSHYSVFSTSKLNSVYSSIANTIGKVNPKNLKVVMDIGDAFEYVPKSADDSIPLPSYTSADRLEWDINELAPGTSNITYKVRLKSEYALYKLTCVSGEITYTDYTGTKNTVSIRPAYAYNELLSDVKITSISPDEGEKGKSHTVTITGEGFFGATVDYYGYKLQPDTVNDTGTEMTVKLPSISKSGVRAVTVTNDKDTSADIDFTVYTPKIPSPKIVISSCVPDEIPIKETAEVTLTGENFADLTVYADGYILSADKYAMSDDGKTMTIQLQMKKEKSFKIKLVRKGYDSDTTQLKATADAVPPKPVPSITAITPNSVMQNSGSTDITVTGSNLNDLTSFSVSGTTLTVSDCTVSADGTEVKFTLPEQKKVTNLTVSLATQYGKASEKISVAAKTYLPPVVTGCNITECKRKTVTQIVLTGENLDNIKKITYDGYTLSDYQTSADGKTLTVTTIKMPSAKPSAKIKIQTSGGSYSYTLPIVS
ncbi:MAG: VWA domain-containing protein [Ruminococcus sp.]|nr:VWA domain-containing protein [Ruminococcus sp.]